MKRIRIAALLLAALTGLCPLLSACAGTEESPQPDPGTLPAETPPEEPEEEPALPDAAEETEAGDPSAAEPEPAPEPEPEAEPEPEPEPVAEEAAALLSYSDPELNGKYLDIAVEYAKTIHDLYWDGENAISKLTPSSARIVTPPLPVLYSFTTSISSMNFIIYIL